MSDASPKFSKKEVERAGKLLASFDGARDDPALSQAFEVLAYWKSAFQDPIDEMNSLLRGLLPKYPSTNVASRIKRNEAIVNKLHRTGKTYSLRTMDDIAGCRVTVPDMLELRAIACDIYEAVGSSSSIKLVGKSAARNYIDNPKADGYRSLHIITLHDSPSYGYQGLHCETQVRTKLQHAWATSLETYGAIARTSLKSGEGTFQERRLFSCVSELFALAEGTTHVPGVPHDKDALTEEIRLLEGKVNAFARLRASTESVSFVSESGDFEDDALCLLDIDYAQQATNIYVFPPDCVMVAQQRYAHLEGEKDSEGADTLRDVLLVRVSSFRSLTEAYPNYSTDIAQVFSSLEDMVGNFWSM